MAIAEALKVNTVMTTLDLKANSIGDDGAKAIAEALYVNTVMTTVDLIYGRIQLVLLAPRLLQRPSRSILS